MFARKSPCFRLQINFCLQKAEGWKYLFLCSNFPICLNLASLVPYFCLVITKQKKVAGVAEDSQITELFMHWSTSFT
jgi:hypothetical protein